jgi:hypothetical protein
VAVDLQRSLRSIAYYPQSVIDHLQRLGAPFLGGALLY